MSIIYLDNFASTPVDKEVLQEINYVMQNNFANPHSVSHELGWECNDIIDNARLKVAKLVGTKSNNVIFTSGATESNNTLIKCLKYNNNKKNYFSIRD
ncbi:MAG: aminotransferase class V-fold PLP-dependent enzyme [Alphaproteobacteria bacterium]